MKRWFPVLFWVGIVIFASTGAGSMENSSLLLRPFLRWFVPDLPSMDEREVNFLARKAGHVVQFFILALLVWRGARVEPPLRVGRWRLAVLIVLFSAALACVSEGIQIFFAVRSASWGDVMLDTAGAVVGVAAVLFFDAINTRDKHGP